MAEATVLALDLGTSSLKGALYSSSGERLALTSAPCSATEPAEYLSAAARVCQEIASAGMAVGACRAEHADAYFDLLRWFGQRPHRSHHLAGFAGRRRIPLVDGELPRCRAARMVRHGSSNRRRGHSSQGAVDGAPRSGHLAPHPLWVLQPKEFLLFHLTGVFAADRWCSKGLINLATGEPAWPFLEIPGKSEPLCPALLVPDSIAGRVANNRFGLPSRTLVTTACRRVQLSAVALVSRTRPKL